MKTTGRSRTMKFIVEDFPAKSSDDLNACAGHFLVGPWITNGFFIDDFYCRSRLPVDQLDIHNPSIGVDYRLMASLLGKPIHAIARSNTREDQLAVVNCIFLS